MAARKLIRIPVLAPVRPHTSRREHQEAAGTCPLFVAPAKGYPAAVPSGNDVEELYAKYSRIVFRRAQELLRDDEAAKDVVQEVFVRVIRAGGRVPREPSPTAWLYRVTTNLCLNRLRDKTRQSALLAARYAQVTEVSPISETRATVTAVLSHMPEEVQDIAVYFFVDEMTYDEIARLTGASRRTIGNRLMAFREVADRLFPGRRLAS